MTSTRRTSVLIATALAVSVATPAHAAPSDPSTSYGPSYEQADGWRFTNCQPDTECLPEGSATVHGVAEATVSYSRETATNVDELTSGHARITQTVQLPRKARSAEITLVWSIDGATSGARATAGRVFTGTYVTARAWCFGKCKAEPADEQVTSCGVDRVRPACDPVRAMPARQTVTQTLTLSDLATQSVQITAEAGAFAGARRGCLLMRDDGTCAHQDPEAGHAGEARSFIRATLHSISVKTSG